MITGNFRVIIVGGGPVGLTAAHALRLAGIDFTILEARSDVVLDVGASLFIGAGSLRIIHQLGLLEKLNAMSSELRRRKVFTSDGVLLKDSGIFDYIITNHGTAPLAFHRADFLKMLYEELPESDRAKILTGKSIIDIATDDHGVKVSCADGSTHEGSIVLGSDGAHSKTRRLMRKMALESGLSRNWDPEIPYTTTYRSLWFCAPPFCSDPGIFETHHKDLMTMSIAGKERSWHFLCEKLPKSTQERASFTQKEMQAYVESFAEFSITETLKVKDLYPKRTADPAMVFLEEGLINCRSWGRIVLAGDSCHKFTPNAGLGFQNGMQDVADLCNKLHKAVAAEGFPTLPTLTKVFQDYEDYRSKAIKSDASISAFMIRMQSWASTFHYIMSRYILKWNFTDKILTSFWGDNKALVLNYVAAEEPFHGAVPYDHKMPKPLNTAE